MPANSSTPQYAHLFLFQEDVFDHVLSVAPSAPSLIGISVVPTFCITDMTPLAKAAAATGASAGRPPRKAAQISFHETAGAPAVVRHGDARPAVIRRSLADPAKSLVVRAKANLPPDLQYPTTDDEPSDIEPKRGNLVDRAFARAVTDGTPGATNPKSLAAAHAKTKRRVVFEELESDDENQAYEPSDHEEENNLEEEMVPTDVSDDEEIVGKGKGKRGKKVAAGSKQPQTKARKVRADQRVAFQTITTTHAPLQAQPARRLQRELSLAVIPQPTATATRPASQSRRPAATPAAGPSRRLVRGSGESPDESEPAELAGSEQSGEEEAADLAMESARGSSIDHDFSPECRQHWTHDRRGRLHLRLSSVGPEKAHIDAARTFILDHMASSDPWPGVTEEDNLINEAWVGTFNRDRDTFSVCPNLAIPLYTALRSRMPMWRGSLFTAVKDSVIDWYGLSPPPKRQEQVRQLLGDFHWLYSHVDDNGRRVGAFGHKAILRTFEKFFFGHGQHSYGFKFPSFKYEVPDVAVALVGTALYAALRSFDRSAGSAPPQFSRKEFGNILDQVLAFYKKKLAGGALPFGDAFPERLRSQASANASSSKSSCQVVVELDDDDDDDGGAGFDPWANEV